jgi:hypothetical protein
MTNPQRYVNRAILFLALAGVVVVVLREIVVRSFVHNPWLNGLILAVLLLGVAYNLRRMVRLRPETRWIEAYRTGAIGSSTSDAPRLLTPIAAALAERDRQRRQRTSFSALSLRYLLDSVSSRLDESRDTARYLTGLLIFLGLLGTFWGLLEALNAIGGVIGTMARGGEDLLLLFNEVIGGLTGPISGMGTAFSASLFGLAGSLVLGFLDLQATQAQNSFYNELEEWLAGLTKLATAEGPAGLEGVGGASMPAYVSAMIQQTADNLDRLQQLMTRGENDRGELQGALLALNQHLGALADRVGREQEVAERLLKAQQDLVRQLAQQQQQRGTDGPGLDPATRDHIRNTDLQLGRLLEEMVRGRGEMSRELRNEIKLVARTIAIAAGEPQMVRD